MKPPPDQASLTGKGKRLAFVSTSAISLNQLMRGQLEFLHSKGAELDIYSGPPDDEIQRLKDRRVGHVYRVPFRRQPHLLWDAICLVWLTALFLFRRYDAVIYSTPKAMLLGSIASFITAQRCRIAWVRGRGYENFHGRKRQIYIALDRITFRLSHKVLFVSPSLRAAYLEDGIDVAQKLLESGFGSSNGVDLDRFRPLSAKERSDERARLRLAANDFVIIVAGRIRKDKGAKEVLELSRRLSGVPNVRILMVGHLEEPDLATDIAKDDRIQLFPPCPDIERFFQVADLHLFLSHREGFGNVAIEAAAVGVPTFGFDVVGVRDSVIRGATGELFPFRDITAVEAGVRTAIADPKQFKGRFSGARDAVAERFSQSTIWNTYAAIFLNGE